MISISVYLLVASICAFLPHASSDILKTVLVFQESSLPLTSENFLSVAIDTGIIRHHLKHFNPNSSRFVTLASALYPSYMRLGGTSADCLFYKNKTREDESDNITDTVYLLDDAEELNAAADITNFTMSSLYTPASSLTNIKSWLNYGSFWLNDGEEWDLINLFIKKVNWDLIFDFNVLLRSDGKWDPQNATALLKDSSEKKYNISGFELGNEPNAFRHVFGREVNASVLQADFHVLKNLLKTFKQYNDSIIVGPDTTQLSKKSTEKYFKSFLEDGGDDVVDKVTFHHYYVDGRIATLNDFMDPEVLDSLRKELITGKNITQSLTPRRNLWIGETASAYGGGAPGLSDRYVAGFMWLDKLGLCAQYGVDVVIRQTFIGGSYALIDNKHWPNPDYWLSLLYKILVGRRVLNAKVNGSQGKFRVYAHCTNTERSKYPTGSVTLYAMNLYDENVQMSLPDFYNQALHIYWLQPGDEDGLTSHFVSLNGEVLQMKSDTELPELLPKKQMKQPVIIPPKTFGFIVIPDAKLTVC